MNPDGRSRQRGTNRHGSWRAAHGVAAAQVQGPQAAPTGGWPVQGPRAYCAQQRHGCTVPVSCPRGCRDSPSHAATRDQTPPPLPLGPVRWIPAPAPSARASQDLPIRFGTYKYMLVCLEKKPGDWCCVMVPMTARWLQASSHRPVRPGPSSLRYQLGVRCSCDLSDQSGWACTGDPT